MPYNEHTIDGTNENIHSEEITWAEYKQLVANGNVKEDKIYFIADLEAKEDMINDLLNTVKTLKRLLQE